MSRWNLAWELDRQLSQTPWWKRKDRKLLEQRIADLRASGDRLYMDTALSFTGKESQA